MLRQTRTHLFSPFKLPPKAQITPTGSRRVPITTPTPISGEVGGMYGVSIPYSDELSRGASYEERMAMSTYSTRLQENATMYPMSPYREGEFDPRYLPSPYPDPMKNRPLLEVGEPDDIPREMKIPVIFLCDVKQDVSTFYNTSGDSNNSNSNNSASENENNSASEQQDEEGDEHATAAKSSDSREEESMIQARKFETHYVNQSFFRRKLQPQRLAIVATTENYRLLGLPERDLKIHAEIPRNRQEYEKLRAKQLWDNERWRFSFEMLFRKYDEGPPELLDDAAEDWDGNEEVYTGSGGGAGGDGRGKGASGKAGPSIKRKAKKVKLF